MVTIGFLILILAMYPCRYAKNPSLYAVELINKPLSPGVSQDSLTKYYSAVYNAVRKHSSTAYVVLSNQLGLIDSKELFPLANGFERWVIDVHYYNLYNKFFDTLNVQQNIDFINYDRSAHLSQVTTSNGPLISVGIYVPQNVELCNAAIVRVKSLHR